MEEKERYVSLERVKSEMEQLRGMDAKSATEVIRGYHGMYVKAVSECIEQVQKLSKLSPVTLPLTDTAIIVAERDFLDKAKDKEGLIAICGSGEDVVDLLNQLWNANPESFEEVVKSRGFVKADEKSA